MTRSLVAILLVVSLTACATRLPPPIVREWTALLTDDGQHVVLATTITAIHPFLTWTLPCDREPGVMTIGSRCAHVRRFRFLTLDRGHRLAIYLEVPPSMKGSHAVS